MIPLWFLPYAVACGDCFLLKPSEKVPLTMSRVFDLIEQVGLPQGGQQARPGVRDGAGHHGGEQAAHRVADRPGRPRKGQPGG
jgi:acyl-CoA reductase-like NAD-dependent aldehyde dehydrogenase